METRRTTATTKKKRLGSSFVFPKLLNQLEIYKETDTEKWQRDFQLKPANNKT